MSLYTNKRILSSKQVGLPIDVKVKDRVEEGHQLLSFQMSNFKQSLGVPFDNRENQDVAPLNTENVIDEISEVDYGPNEQIALQHPDPHIVKENDYESTINDNNNKYAEIILGDNNNLDKILANNQHDIEPLQFKEMKDHQLWTMSQ